jgi:hypothetical protein
MYEICLRNSGPGVRITFSLNIPHDVNDTVTLIDYHNCFRRVGQVDAVMSFTRIKNTEPAEYRVMLMSGHRYDMICVPSLKVWYVPEVFNSFKEARVVHLGPDRRFAVYDKITIRVKEASASEHV